jgi:hypothetical protein
MHPVRAALAGLIDYAGLFPPASLDLACVVENQRRYVSTEDRWLLGRLIVPLPRLDQLETLLAGDDDSAEPWTISVLARTGDPLDHLEDRVIGFNERHLASAAVVAIELVADTADEITRIAHSVPERFERYIELPLNEHLPELLDAVSLAGCYAKVRTGGVAAEAFPDPAMLSAFIAHGIARDVPFKATAGLHHPIRGSYRLTYEPQSPFAMMHGFVNLIVAAGLLATGQIDEVGSAAVLETTNPAAFRFERDGIHWDSHLLETEACVHTRAHVLRSVGSCSFEDAVADLRRLGWLA